MSESTCPKCSGPRDAKALYCPFCGTVFSRFEAGGAAPAPAPRPARPLGPASGFEPEAVNPYQAPTASVAPRYRPEPPARTQAQASLAGRGTRLVARIVDGFAVAGVIIACALPAGLLSGPTPRDEIPTGVVVAMVMGLLLLGGVNLYLLGDRGQTIGKMLFKVKIVRTNGESANLIRILVLRILPMNALGFIPILGALIGLVNVLMIFGQERRCLHDLFADTVVVNA